MRRQLVLSTLAAVGIIVLQGAGIAQAQYTNPTPRFPQFPQVNNNPPRLSPYLNLLRGGDPAANYYLGVVPEREQRVFNREFGSAIDILDRRTAAGAETVIDDVRPRGLPPTGHSVRFLNASPYYLSGTSTLGYGAGYGGGTTGYPAGSRFGR
jgi:hypothetical protein